MSDFIGPRAPQEYFTLVQEAFRLDSCQHCATDDAILLARFLGNVCRELGEEKFIEISENILTRQLTKVGESLANHIDSWLQGEE